MKYVNGHYRKLCHEDITSVRREHQGGSVPGSFLRFGDSTSKWIDKHFGV